MALCSLKQDTLIFGCFILVQPRKCQDMTKIVYWDIKHSPRHEKLPITLAYDIHAREPLYWNSAIIAMWLQSMSAQNSVPIAVKKAVKKGNILVLFLPLKIFISYYYHL